MPAEHPEIAQWLSERGYPPEAIQRILQRLDQFDEKINRESVFDAMETGELDMDALIKEALSDE
jgi:hypothetical protein